MTWGERIVQARTAKGMPRDHLADVAGVSKMTLSNYETDKTDPSLMNLVCIADVLGMSLDNLTGHKVGTDKYTQMMDAMQERLEAVENQNRELLGVIRGIYDAVQEYADETR